MYVKLFQSIYDGSLATRGPWEALITFQQMLALCDKTGIIDMTAEAISRRTTVPLEVIEKGIAALEQPDPESRRPDHDGRRIVRLADHRSWGWQIVNYSHYRSLRTAEDRREYMRNFMRKKRAETKGNGADESPVIETIPCVGDTSFAVHQSFVTELERLYPGVDVPQTLREIRGWCIGNPTKRKTVGGARRFITSWLAREQNKPS